MTKLDIDQKLQIELLNKKIEFVNLSSIINNLIVNILL
jgi:hypothetical protein